MRLQTQKIANGLHSGVFVLVGVFDSSFRVLTEPSGARAMTSVKCRPDQSQTATRSIELDLVVSCLPYNMGAQGRLGVKYHLESPL